MSKKVLNSGGSDKPKKTRTTLAELADSVIFTPTPRQRKVKAKFWTKFIPGPFFAGAEDLSLPQVQSIVNVSGLKEWWNHDGFIEWFTNREEAREKLEYLFMTALETAEEILTDPETQPGARVNCIKIIGELANKFPSKWQERYADDDISKMNEAQLKAFLAQQGIQVNEEKVLDVKSQEDGSSKTETD